MKRLLFALIALTIAIGLAFVITIPAQAATPPLNLTQGGLGTTTVPAGWYVVGSDPLRVTAQHFIDLASNITGILPEANGGTGAATFGDPFYTYFHATTTDALSEGSTNKYYTNARAIGSLLTGFTTTTGTVASTDSILVAIEKLAGNAASYLTNISGLVTAGDNVTITGSGTSGSPYVISATGGGSGSAAWGDITGTLSDQTDLQAALDAKADSADLSMVALTGEYSDLIGLPSIPTRTSDLTNDSGFITSYTETDPIYSADPAASITSTDLTHLSSLSGTNTGDQDLSGYALTSSLADVALSGSYNDLTDAPTITTYTPGAGLTLTTGAFSVNTTQNIAKLSNLTGNGFVKTSGGDGTLSIDTNTYLTGNQTITLSGDVSGSGATSITTTIGAGKVTNGMLAGSIAASKLIGTDIATVGTITAGTWNGTAIANSYLANSTISGIALGSNLANLTATDSTLTFSGSYNGGTARTVGINLANSNTWTGLQKFNGNASTTAFTNSGKTWLTALASPTTSLVTVNSAGLLGTTTASTGGQVLITSGSIPNAASFNLTNIPATYSSIVLELSGVSMDTNSRSIRVQVSTNNGSSFDTTTANYQGYYINSTTINNSGAPTIYIQPIQQSADTSENTITISGYQGGTQACANTIQNNPTGSVKSIGNACYTGSISAINALQILLNSTGNFDAGTYALYGIK